MTVKDLNQFVDRFFGGNPDTEVRVIIPGNLICSVESFQKRESHPGAGDHSLVVQPYGVSIERFPESPEFESTES